MDPFMAFENEPGLVNPNSSGERWASVELQITRQPFLIHLKSVKLAVQLLKLLLIVAMH